MGIVEEVGGTVTTVHPGNWAAVNADAFPELFESWKAGMTKAAVAWKLKNEGKNDPLF